MALTYTPDAALGWPCPNVQLKTVEGKDFDVLHHITEARATVVMFICNHCPYVQAIEDRLLKLAHTYQSQGVAFIGICANDPSDYPEDAPGALLKRWQDKSYGFPYLIDETQAVAKAFGAVCTPDLYLFDGHRKLAYRGRLDDSWRDPSKVVRQELREALDAVLAGRPPAAKQNPSMGCSIKWRNP